MPRFLQFALLSLITFLVAVPIASAQDEVPATPGSDIDVCGSLADTASPEAAYAPEVNDATFDLAYVDTMITSHRSAILMLLIAEERAEHPELREFVSYSLEARRGTIESLLAWRSEQYPTAAWVAADQAMAIFDEVAHENPGRGGVAGAREIASEPHIEELCTAADQPFDLLVIDHLLPQISGELLLSSSAQDVATDSIITTTAQTLSESLQREINALFAWRTLWFPDAEPPHAH